MGWDERDAGIAACFQKYTRFFLHSRQLDVSGSSGKIVYGHVSVLLSNIVDNP